MSCGDGRLSPQGGTITSVQGGNGMTGGATGGVATLNVIGATGGGLSVLTDSVGLITTCATSDGLKWDGAAWVCTGGAEVTGTGTVDTVPKWTGASTLGNSTITDTSTLTTISKGSSTAAAAPAGTVLTLQQVDGTANYLYLRGNISKFVALGNASTALDGGLSYDSAGSRVLGLISANTHRITLDSAGSMAIGDTATTAVSDNVDIVTIGNTGTGQTTSQKSLTRLTNTGSYDTTSAAITTYGVFSSITSIRFVGANDLTNVGGYFNASGAQVNKALQTDAGDVLLNQTSGSTTIGLTTSTTNQLTVNGQTVMNGNIGSAGFALLVTNTAAAATSARNGAQLRSNGTYDTTAGVITVTAAQVISDSTRSAGANNLVNRGLLIDVTGAQANQALIVDRGDVILNNTSGTTAIRGNTTLGDAPSDDIHSVNGTLTVNSTQSAVALTGNATPAGSTTASVQAVRGVNNGTYDTTAGGLTEFSGRFIASATRSAGANDLQNVAGRFEASGGQVNRAIETTTGDVFLNLTSGNTTIGAGSTTTSTLTFNGRESIWTSNPSASTTGTSMLSLARGGSFDTTGGVLVSRGLNSSVTSTRSAGANDLQNIAATLTASGAQVNIALQTNAGDVILGNVGSVNVDVNSDLTKFGTTAGDGSIYIKTDTAGIQSINADFAADSDNEVLALNYYGYNGGATRFRMIAIYDGKGSQMATFTGSTNVFATTGAVSLGNDSTDAHTLNGNLTFSSAPTAGSVKIGSINGRIRIGVQVLTASSGTYTPTTGTKSVLVRMCGGGGGGGGAKGNLGVSAGFAGGGASGAYIEKWIDPAATVTGGSFTNGAAGTKGDTTPTSGGTGGDSTIVIQSVTYTAKGGTGGIGSNAVTVTGASAGGIVQTGSTAGDVSWAGQVGGHGVTLSGTAGTGAAGSGGSSLFGTGGPGRVAVGDASTVPAQGKCSGGGGAADDTTGGNEGADGTAGLIIVEEYF